MKEIKRALDHSKARDIFPLLGQDGRVYEYSYDGFDRVNSYTVTKDSDEILSVQKSYDASGREASHSWTLDTGTADETTFEQEYIYTDGDTGVPDGLLKTVTLKKNGSAIDTLGLEHDALGRLTRKTGVLDQRYSYHTREVDEEVFETTLVSDYKALFNETEKLRSRFEYDPNGNIVKDTTTVLSGRTNMMLWVS